MAPVGAVRGTQRSVGYEVHGVTRGQWRHIQQLVEGLAAGICTEMFVVAALPQPWFQVWHSFAPPHR